MSSDSQLLQGNQIKIGKQIVLPLSKAVEISARALRARFWRSMITMSGIILAIAFMVSIGVGGQVVNGLWRHKDEWVLVQVRQTREEFKYVREDGSETAVEIGRDKAVFNTVGEILLRKGLQEPGSPRAAAPAEAPGDEAETPGARAGEGEGEKASSAGKDRREYWLVGLSLCVAVVGIVNSMLMSVTERFREIGTMKCLGALDSFVVKLFLLESMFVGVVGTVIGIVIGLLLTAVSSLAGFSSLSHLLLGAVPWQDLLILLGVALGAGTLLSVAGALYPALVASRMEPVAALRQDA
jgi:ABC-type antimicrobial peptide transport system permease subunit